MKFSTEIFESYGKVLESIKDIGLLWAYPPAGSPPPIIPDQVLNLVEEIKTINDKEALQSAFFLWLEINSQKLPLPPLQQIIPYICSYWNFTKGGSDVTMYLMDLHRLFVSRAYTTLSTTIIGRILSVVNVLCHRLNHLETAQSNLGEYPSLAHYRNAASQRFDYFDTL